MIHLKTEFIEDKIELYSPFQGYIFLLSILNKNVVSIFNFL